MRLMQYILTNLSIDPTNLSAVNIRIHGAKNIQLSMSLSIRMYLVLNGLKMLKCLSIWRCYSFHFHFESIDILPSAMLMLTHLIKMRYSERRCVVHLRRKTKKKQERSFALCIPLKSDTFVQGEEEEKEENRNRIYDSFVAIDNDGASHITKTHYSSRVRDNMRASSPMCIF